MSENGRRQALKIYQEAKLKDPEALLFKQPALNLLGYQLMQAKKKTDYDSLAEAYVNIGEPKRAQASSEKALELLPGDSTLDSERRSHIRKVNEARLEKLKSSS